MLEKGLNFIHTTANKGIVYSIHIHLVFKHISVPGKALFKINNNIVRF